MRRTHRLVATHLILCFVAMLCMLVGLFRLGLCLYGIAAPIGIKAHIETRRIEHVIRMHQA
jgi:hypothetical protein